MTKCINILYIRYASKHESKVPHSWKIPIAIMALIAQVTMYCVVFMVNYAISAGSRVQEEKEKKHVAALYP